MPYQPTPATIEEIAARTVIATLPAALALEASCRHMALGYQEFSRVRDAVIEDDLSAWNAHVARTLAAPRPATAIISYNHFVWDCWTRHLDRWAQAHEAIHEASLQ